MKKIFFIILLLSASLFSAYAADQVKNFSFYDLEGKTHQFNEYRGKWVLVNYWATYCPPCRAEIPDIERFLQDNKDGVVVLGFDAGSTNDAGIKAFQKEMGISYPLIPVQDSTLFAFGEIRGIPTSFLISPEGNVLNKTVGIITYDDLDYFVHPPIFSSAN